MIEHRENRFREILRKNYRHLRFLHGRLMSNALSNIVNEEELVVVRSKYGLLAFCHTGPTKRIEKNRVELKKRVELKFILEFEN